MSPAVMSIEVSCGVVGSDMGIRDGIICLFYLE